PHILQLRNKQAAQLQASLETLLDERAEALGLAENAARDNAVIIPDERTNSLVVLATDDMYGLIEGIATQLDQADSYRIIQTDFRRLEHADALKLASLLDQLFARKQEAEQNVAEGGQREVLEVLADSRTNALMLTGTPDYLAEANALVTQLDQ